MPTIFKSDGMKKEKKLKNIETLSFWVTHLTLCGDYQQGRSILSLRRHLITCKTPQGTA